MELSENQTAILVKVKAAQDTGNFDMAKPKTPAYAQLVGKGLIESNPAMADANGKQPFRLTTQGLQYLMENQTSQATETATPDFTIASVPMPSISRGTGATSKYPFDKLANGQSFFVPAEGRKNLSKTLGSVVGSRNKKATGNVRFTTRSIEDGAPWGKPGVKGVAIFRNDEKPAQADTPAE